MLPPERVTNLTHALMMLAFTAPDPGRFIAPAAAALAECMDADAVLWICREEKKVAAGLPKKDGSAPASEDLDALVRELEGLWQKGFPEDPLHVPDSGESADEPAQSFLAKGFRSFLILPLASDQGPSGAVAVAWLRPGPGWAGGPALSRVTAGLLSLGISLVRERMRSIRAERMLSRSEKAAVRQEKLKALGLLASGVAHNVNNLLSPITGYADLLLKGEPDVSENGRRLLKIMRNAGRDISETVLRLNQFSGRADEKEKMPVIDLNDVTSEMIRLTRPYWKDMPQKHGFTVTLITDFSPEPARVRGSAEEIRQAMTNLMINAVDALEQGGEVALAVQVKNGETVFTISDSGSGMDESVLDRSLDPFFSTKEQSSGMGLSVAYGVMRRHGGRVEMDSEPGRGTRVRLVFPTGPKSGDQLPEAAPEAEDGSPLRVLYVDDEPEVCEVMRQILESLGHEVDVAEGGVEGIEVFLKSVEDSPAYDLVITDMGMPKKDGLAVARAVKTASASTPVLLFSGWSAQTLEKNKGANVVDGIVSKPPTIDKVNHMIKAVMAGKKG